MNALVAASLTIVLLAVNAFFVAAEFSLISSRRDRLEALVAAGNKRARTVLHATEHLSANLAGAQFGITIASLLLGKVGEPAIAHLIETPAHAIGLPEQFLHPVSFAIALIIVTFLHIIVGEMVPKNIALAGPESVAMLLVPIHVLFVRLTRPFITTFNFIARITLKLFGIEQRDELDTTVNPKQLATMIRESQDEGLLDKEETDRLNKALRSESRTVEEVMIPLDQVRTIPFGSNGPTIAELEAAVAATGYSRFPITNHQGSFIGFIHAKDVLDRMVGAKDYADTRITRGQLRTLTNVTATIMLDDGLRLMRRRKAHMAQVSKDGRVVGIVTLEDLIEEYVGTVRDWTHEA